jgi:hypothetical protein
MIYLGDGGQKEAGKVVMVILRERTQLSLVDSSFPMPRQSLVADYPI